MMLGIIVVGSILIAIVLAVVMLRRHKHKKFWGTRGHVFVGYGAWAFVGRRCVCGKVVVGK